jgi:hypothetical protein
MIELGLKSKIAGVKQWPTFRMYRRPKHMPKIPEGHTIVCGFDQGDGERMFICETLEHVRTLYDEHAMGHAIHIAWYHTGAFNDTIARVTAHPIHRSHRKIQSNQEPFSKVLFLYLFIIRTLSASTTGARVANLRRSGSIWELSHIGRGYPLEHAPLSIRKPRKREVYKEQVPVIASIGRAHAIAINELLCTIFLIFFIKGNHKITVASVSVAVPHTAQAAGFLVGVELRLIDGGSSHFCAIAIDPPAHEQDVEGIAVPLWFPGNLETLWHETASRFPIPREHRFFFFVELSH